MSSNACRTRSYPSYSPTSFPAYLMKSSHPTHRRVLRLIPPRDARLTLTVYPSYSPTSSKLYWRTVYPSYSATPLLSSSLIVPLYLETCFYLILLSCFLKEILLWELWIAFLVLLYHLLHKIVFSLAIHFRLNVIQAYNPVFILCKKSLDVILISTCSIYPFFISSNFIEFGSVGRVFANKSPACSYRNWNKWNKLILDTREAWISYPGTIFNEFT